jgi:hypothetical protein
MREQVHRLCVEISPDSHWNVDISGELLQPFRLGFPGAVGGKAATANLRNLDSECERGPANDGGRFLRERRGMIPGDPSVVGSRCPEVTIGSNENCLGYPEKDQRP